MKLLVNFVLHLLIKIFHLVFTYKNIHLGAY